MSFGGGAHFCLGASLARAGIEIAFRTLLERLDSIEFDGPGDGLPRSTHTALYADAAAHREARGATSKLER